MCPLVQVPLEMVAQSHNSYVEAEIHPPTLEELGAQLEDSGATFHTYLEHLVQGLQKEAKEKFKGWVTCPSTDSTELAFKKVILGLGKIIYSQRATSNNVEFVLLRRWPLCLQGLSHIGTGQSSAPESDCVTR